MICQHKSLDVSASDVLMDDGRRNVLVQVGCADCGQSFQFKGNPGGASPNFPRISTDMTTLCAPIELAAPKIIEGEPVTGNLSEIQYIACMGDGATLNRSGIDLEADVRDNHHVLTIPNDRSIEKLYARRGKLVFLRIGKLSREMDEVIERLKIPEVGAVKARSLLGLLMRINANV